MIVSWNWLKDYINLDMPLEELTGRLTMAGLNLESTSEIDGDFAIDLEVTSNRPDCLGHVGVAREIGVLFDKELTIPLAQPQAVGEKTAAVTSVAIDSEDLCPRYIARVVRGVKIGPSPDWLQRRLKALGIAAINNVVDVTNYVLMECGQPLHAFDFDKLRGRKVIVRRARAGEKIVAIDQREYPLDPEMCVIADADRPVAIGGVMGGLDTEIGDATTSVLVEVADFAPLSIRNTARRLGLHSPSSYRFERGVDPGNLDWASRRCCELILKLAGGELLDEPVVAGPGREIEQPPITLRFAQIPRILGIDVAQPEAVEILTSLGLKPVSVAAASSRRKRTVAGSHRYDSGEPRDGRGEFVPPSWRRDLSREADLIEEVARIHGYDKIPDNVAVPLTVSSRSRHDRVGSVVRDVLTAAGFYEAITLSFVSDESVDLFTPRGDRPRLNVEHSSRKHENVLRQSLVPSLMQSRRENERHGVFGAHLFEIAKVYLRAAPNEPEQQTEPTMIGLVSGRTFNEVKGVLESLVRRLNRAARVTARPSDIPQFVAGRGAELFIDNRSWGWLGEIDRSVSDRLDLRDAVTAAEVDLAVLEAAADLVPQYEPLPQFPAVERDLNFVLKEETTWEELDGVVRSAAGPLLESLSFGGQYRGKQIPADRKSYLVTLSYRSPHRTLTNEEVEAIQRDVIAACEKKLGATLR